MERLGFPALHFVSFLVWRSGISWSPGVGETWGGKGHEVLVRTVLAAAEMQGQMANTTGVVFVECFDHEDSTRCCKCQA